MTVRLDTFQRTLAVFGSVMLTAALVLASVSHVPVA